MSTFLHSGARNTLDELQCSLTRPDIPNLRQRSNWDCGLVCIQMVLYTQGMKSVSLDQLSEIVATKSVWTIDLARLLSHFNICFTFYTISLGVNPEYKNFTYYANDISKDEVRVNQTFKDADKLGIKIKFESLNLKKLQRILSTCKTLAVVLVDVRYLPRGFLYNFVARNFTPFTGHYILVYAYSEKNNLFYYKDPARGQLGVISANELQTARCSAA